jgi:phosphoglycolate phosphatase-like HAD superfamily hydrolase
MPDRRLLVCDLDNTLYDWISYFVPSFYAMVDTVVKITGCDREKLLDDFRAVHQRHGDSEQPFALLETDTIKKIYGNYPTPAVLDALDPAFHAFNSARRQTLKLHAGVHETLSAIRAAGMKIVAHTESKLYGVVDRLYRLDLFQYFAKVYCRERTVSPHPDPESASSWSERVPWAKIIELSRHQAKPNPEVLLEICADENISPKDAAFVGDSIARDILMAKRANVFSIWAEYGSKHDHGLYNQLVRISHWTPAEVARERKLTEEAQAIEPDFIARHSFAEVLIALKLGAHVESAGTS